jgi:hypothetical protein
MDVMLRREALACKRKGDMGGWLGKVMGARELD